MTQGDLKEHYDVIVQHQAALGAQAVSIGTPGHCRYCGNTDPASFTSVAHTFPEALGNRWVISVDECDGCNSKFSICDAALTEAVGAFLTLGGVPRKRGPSRQLGKSGSQSVAVHTKESGERRLSFRLTNSDSDSAVQLDPASGTLRLKIPLAPVPFKPLRAYKAVAKMGFALLPDSDLKHYETERAWLVGAEDENRIRDHLVIASFGFVGNAPPLVVGRLLRRRNPEVPLPHTVFILCVGSICLQIALKADSLDDHVPADAISNVNVRCTNILGTPEAPVFRVDYVNPVLWDWSSSLSTPQPMEAVILSFNQITRQGSFEPVFRSNPANVRGDESSS